MVLTYQDFFCALANLRNANPETFFAGSRYSRQLGANQQGIEFL
jgi:hypothetical protein